jgi:hypothetical protein
MELTRNAYEAGERLLKEQQKTLLVGKRLLRQLNKAPDVSTVEVFLTLLKPLYTDFKRLRIHTATRRQR